MPHGVAELDLLLGKVDRRVQGLDHRVADQHRRLAGDNEALNQAALSDADFDGPGTDRWSPPKWNALWQCWQWNLEVS